MVVSYSRLSSSPSSYVGFLKDLYACFLCRFDILKLKKKASKLTVMCITAYLVCVLKDEASVVSNEVSKERTVSEPLPSHSDGFKHTCVSIVRKGLIKLTCQLCSSLLTSAASRRSRCQSCVPLLPYWA